MTSLLDFYRQHQISPVAQDISDLPAHFARRAALYRSLGLPTPAIWGSEVLEIGPGTGENALYVDEFGPERYVLLEPNPSAARELRRRFPRDVIERRIEEYDGGEFDLVICEGLLGLCGSDPAALLEHVVKHVRSYGVLVITCIDAISDHAEVMRRAMANELIDRSAPLADQVAILRPVFAPHLATLKGMTRSVDDWIIDNMLNPASIGPTFSIPDACEALAGRFDVLGCSPRGILGSDWHWYKEAPVGNQWAIDAYWTQAHNLYDYRRVAGPRTRADNEQLMAHCLNIREIVLSGGNTDDIGAQVNDIGWFGRGQQYLSFVKR